ncbi:hypothetical protein ALC53_14224 [Atta colombica]|uniref:Uncharacterized protein n=1 Tax=Atta colombica TaxID=520822 RepID=A0A195ATH9_9HYME|nr:hypothetical protein ALC53_14224 [Atta colombica]
MISRASGVRTTGVPRRIAAPSAFVPYFMQLPTSLSFTRGTVRPITIMSHVEIRLPRPVANGQGSITNTQSITAGHSINDA